MNEFERQFTEEWLASPCAPKIGFISGEKFCAKHGREAGWPCAVQERESASTGENDG